MSSSATGDGTWLDEAEWATPDDVEALDAEGSDAEAQADLEQPVLAVVGRPNVGKSTLVNRILGRREAVVQDVPGVTRDRVAYDALWSGRRFTVVDTGGWEPDARGLRAAVAGQAELAMKTADAVLLVVDATVGATAAEEAVARVLRRSSTPVLLAATKVDDERAVADTAALWSLGLGEPHPVSGLHGRGTGDLLD
ncbi:MAG: GTPase, partial [Pseudonocardiaceae bacterium]